MEDLNKDNQKKEIEKSQNMLAVDKKEIDMKSLITKIDHRVKTKVSVPN